MLHQSAHAETRAWLARRQQIQHARDVFDTVQGGFALEFGSSGTCGQVGCGGLFGEDAV
jgi:hypothetical protein